jgi:hypothetical protein
MTAMTAVTTVATTVVTTATRVVKTCCCVLPECQDADVTGAVAHEADGRRGAPGADGGSEGAWAVGCARSWCLRAQ